MVVNARYLELGLAFWLGIGLMSVINVWKLAEHQNAISYSWIVASVSLVFIAICAILLAIRR